ncbi:MAG TPA: hypothetical protein VL970_10750 [Candidatus Acidoferrales bacterium]|nr:hypothetical protein [Candidatus Acidoferrales bacterium]
MKTITKSYSDYNYDEVVSLACQIWQAGGCQFGRYQVCWQQAKSRLLTLRPQARSKTESRGHKA